MGVDSRRPPLPAPTESIVETSGPDTEVATTLTTRTDRSHFTIPEDGGEVTIPIHRHHNERGNGGGHRRQKSQTSLLIEYFEAGHNGDKTKSKPSVRVRVTPSGAKKSKSQGGHDAVQITGIGHDRKPSYTRRISLGPRSTDAVVPDVQNTELSHSSESSGRPPVEIEVNHNASDVSNPRSSRGLLFAPQESNVSSMPPDSMLDGSEVTGAYHTREIEHDDIDAIKERARLKAPSRSRDHNASQDRITKRVMEKLSREHNVLRPSSTSSLRDTLDSEDYLNDERRIPAHSQHKRESTLSAADSSFLTSQLSPSQISYRSGSSQASRLTNNSKVLAIVEDTIKRVILPEINALKKDQGKEKGTRSTGRRRSSASHEEVITEDQDVGRERRIVSKPRVVLNKRNDDPGTLLSRGDSEYRKTRRSSRDSPDDRRPSSRRSSTHLSEEITEESPRHRRSDKHSRSNKARDAAAAALVGGTLTAAALKHHDSHEEVRERRERHANRKKSRSRTTSADGGYSTPERRALVPPMPLSGKVEDSELTRDSLVSSNAGDLRSRENPVIRTPVREVSRGSFSKDLSLAGLVTPELTPNNAKPNNKDRVAALAAAAGLGGTAVTRAIRHVDTDGYGDPSSPYRPSSVASVSSLRKHFEDRDALIPHEDQHLDARAISPALPRGLASPSPHGSQLSSPTTARLARSVRSPASNHVEHVDKSRVAMLHEGPSAPGTPNGESIDEWYERQHQMNEQYRNSYGEQATNRSSYQTNPYSDTDKRITMYDDDDGEVTDGRNVKPVAAVPRYVHDSLGVESNVASLMDPSILSSSVRSSQDGTRLNATYADRMQQQLRSLDTDKPPPLYEGSTISQTMPSSDRWAALRGHAKALSSANSENAIPSPAQSESRSVQEKHSIEPVMGKSGIPVANDPLPEIGHFDDSASDMTTNPSVIQGPLGGEDSARDPWPYTPEPAASARKAMGSRGSLSVASDRSRGRELLEAAAGGATLAATAHALDSSRPKSDRLTPDIGRDGRNNRQGFTTQSRSFSDHDQARSAGSITPEAKQQRFEQRDTDDFTRAMDAQDIDAEDPFKATKTDPRRSSGRSHGMSSPQLYDSATGNGLDRIQSKDIVALMDHLTVRDAQRSARDTEILVTLVRSAAEMRQSFDEMKRFIVEQDRLIMESHSRDSEHTVQKLMTGPRPQPSNTPRSTRTSSQEDIQVKRKNVLQRALRGLTGGKRVTDLNRVEDMLMQILDNVEDLKQGGAPGGPSLQLKPDDGTNAYEKMRGEADLKYNPGQRAADLGSPSKSNGPSPALRSGKHFHSGYDGRRGSVDRVSTVVEGDEDGDLEPHERVVLDHQFENNESMITPTRDARYQRPGLAYQTPPKVGGNFTGSPRGEITPRAIDGQSKHVNSTSSAVAAPKVSRWSKTTASSIAPDPASIGSPNLARIAPPASVSSHSGSELASYDDAGYNVHSDDRLRSTQSLAREEQHARSVRHSESRSLRSQSSRITRTPSPLIPSEASQKDYHPSRYENESPIGHEDDEGFDDPKYQAHRNSLLLQHPQPRQGSTSRHQNTLETQAKDYENPSTSSDVSQRTVSDFDPATWGSAGAAALSRSRFVPAEDASSARAATHNRHDSDPLIPRNDNIGKVGRDGYGEEGSETESDEDDIDWEPQYSNSGFSRNGYYSSPYGSGHLLEPIEEVRYSLETDRTMSPRPQVASARAVDPQPSGGGRVTGPRPMSSRNASASQPDNTVETSGTVRRRPVPTNQGSHGSLHSETF